jgi:hypothetical protein
VGELELDLVADLAHARWRVRRCSTIETGVLDLQMDHNSNGVTNNYEDVDEAARMTLAFRELVRSDRTLDVLSRYDARSRRNFDRTLRNLLQLQNASREKQFLPNEPETDTEAIVV